MADGCVDRTVPPRLSATAQRLLAWRRKVVGLAVSSSQRVSEIRCAPTAGVSLRVQNQFSGNLAQIIVSGGKTANRNVWEGNYWSDYEGFDRDDDNQGDTPYELYAYADRLWRDAPHAQFFKGSPVLETLDFLERLAPFTEPNLLVRDTTPVMTKFIEPRDLNANSAEDDTAVESNTQKSAYEKLLEAQQN